MIKNRLRIRLVEENRNELDSFLTEPLLVDILRGYLETALWTEEERLNDEMSSDDDYEDDDSDEIEKLIRLQQSFNNSFSGFLSDDIDGNSKIQAFLDIKKFAYLAGIEAIREALTENDPFQLGMDIWLSRNGHGSGFFDRNYEHEKELTSASEKIKPVDLYISDSGLLMFSNA